MRKVTFTSQHRVSIRQKYVCWNARVKSFSISQLCSAVKSDFPLFLNKNLSKCNCKSFYCKKFGYVVFRKSTSLLVYFYLLSLNNYSFYITTNTYFTNKFYQRVMMVFVERLYFFVLRLCC